MSSLMPRRHAVGRRLRSARRRVGAAAEPWRARPPADLPPAPHDEVLAKAGQLIVEWAVEVARYEADPDWRWVHGAHEDPAVTAGALARLIRETRSVAERAEALLMVALADED